MPKAKICAVRHGETDDNKNLVFQGQEGSNLNARGQGQAARLGARLALAGARPVALYASDLRRARHTADILGEALGLAPIEDPDLREIFLGAWQGLSHAEIAARFPEEWAAWRAGAPDLRRGGGETYAELAARMVRAMDRIAEAHAGGTVVVVSHGAALKTFAGHVLGMPPGCEVWLRSFRVQDNTGASLFERDDDRTWRMLVWNDTAHLGDGLLGARG